MYNFGSLELFTIAIIATSDIIPNCYSGEFVREVRVLEGFCQIELNGVCRKRER